MLRASPLALPGIVPSANPLDSRNVETLSVRVSEKARAELQAEADARGIQLGAYLREILMARHEAIKALPLAEELLGLVQSLAGRELFAEQLMRRIERIERHLGIEP